MDSIERAEVAHKEASVGYAGRIFGQIQSVIKEAGGQSGALVKVLQHAQGLIGYLPPPVLKTISRDLKIPLKEIYREITESRRIFRNKPRSTD